MGSDRRCTLFRHAKALQEEDDDGVPVFHTLQGAHSAKARTEQTMHSDKRGGGFQTKSSLASSWLPSRPQRRGERRHRLHSSLHLTPERARLSILLSPNMRPSKSWCSLQP